MSSRSSKKIHEAEKLNSDFQSYFGGKYSADRGSNKLQDMWKMALLSRCRLFILFCICFFTTMFLLYKSRPKWILHRRSYDEPDRISVYNLLKYTIIISLIIFIITSVLAHRFPKAKNILFKSQDCDMCSSP